MVIKQIFTWWNNQTIGTRIWSFFNGNLVGSDKFGNKYFTNKTGSKRWVIYEGEVDSSKVPPEWNGWIRFTSNAIPNTEKKFFWEKEHEKNHTGTSRAYYPNNSILKNTQKKKTQEYEQWSPKE
tara:strand:+ start:583 stop:954 length:372 start_codon:yes stop_codon:yes gene_type:complete